MNRRARAGPPSWLVLLFLLQPMLAAAANPPDTLAAETPWIPHDPRLEIHLSPDALTVDPIGRLWILDRSRGRILRLEGSDGRGPSFGLGRGGRPAAFEDISSSGPYLYLLDATTQRIVLHDLDGGYQSEVSLEAGIAASGRKGIFLSRLAVGSSGDLWLLDRPGSRLLHFDRRGRFLEDPLESLAGSRAPRGVVGLARTAQDGLLLLDPAGSIVLLVPRTGGARPVAWSEAEERPIALASDARGSGYLLHASGRLSVRPADGGEGWSAHLEGAAPIPSQIAVLGESVLVQADPAQGALRRWRLKGRRGDGGRP